MKWITNIRNWFVSLVDFNKDNKITGEDFDVAKKAVEEKTTAAVEEVKFRAHRIKEEVQDVGKAVAEVGNQIEDVGRVIVSPKKRPGRKKKTD